MTEADFKKNMTYLVRKYIGDDGRADEILKKIDASGADGAKGILHDFCEASGNIDLADSKIIKDINFYFI